MDELDELEASVRAAARRRRVIVWSVVGVVALLGLTPCAIVTWNIGASVQDTAERRELASQRATAEQIAAVDEATRAAEASLSRRANAWRAAMSSAASLAPRPDLGPCPVRLPMRQPYSAGARRLVQQPRLLRRDRVRWGQAFPHVRTRDALPAEPPRVALAREEASRLRQRIRGEGTVEQLAEIVTAARALASSFWTYDVVVFTTRWGASVRRSRRRELRFGPRVRPGGALRLPERAPALRGLLHGREHQPSRGVHRARPRRRAHAAVDARRRARRGGGAGRRARAAPPRRPSLEPVAPDEGALP
ncbi:MAG: hypothetical protein M5U28_49205 [Sandaracinaceae bacterium]|nr:hypothetical protein [Sandaracinaceae bacterium]